MKLAGVPILGKGCQHHAAKAALGQSKFSNSADILHLLLVYSLVTGAIKGEDLSDTVVVVVRYFGEYRE